MVKEEYKGNMNFAVTLCGRRSYEIISVEEETCKKDLEELREITGLDFDKAVFYAGINSKGLRVLIDALAEARRGSKIDIAGILD